MAAVLALAMKGLGRYMNHVGRAEPHLKQLGLKVYADAQLQEYANLLDGFILSQRGAAFSCRAAYDAAGLSLSKTTFLKVVLNVCDIQFLVQHVLSDLADAGDDLKTLVVPEEDRPLFLDRLYEDVARGLLPHVTQHPCLYSAQFLRELEAFCQNKNRLQQLVHARDLQHGMPLLHWAAWGPSTCLLEWCLSVLHEQDTSKVQPKVFLCTAFAMTLARREGRHDNLLVWKQVRDLAKKQLSSPTQHISLPLISVSYSFTHHTLTLHHSLQALASQPLCSITDPSFTFPPSLMSVQWSGDVIDLTLPCQQPYLALRLLSDTRMDEQDADGNTVLHLVAQAG
jgi:hypothetical protein